jgi:DNA-binding transcriptional LysR family regulator
MRDIAPAALSAQRWLIGPQDVDRTTATGLFFARNGLEPAQLSPYTSHAAAVAAAASGEGIILALAHSVIDALRRRSLVRLDVRGTPIVELWHASTLGLGRALPAALAFQRFATTPEATQAMSSGRAGTASARARPAVHVTLWRSVAEELDAGTRR